MKTLSLPTGPQSQPSRDRTYEVIRAADLVIVASGTATLETAILQKPMVIVYRVSPVSLLGGQGDDPG